MKKFLGKIGYFLLGLMGLCAVICGVVYSSITSKSTMAEGFTECARAQDFELKGSFSDYAGALTEYLTGKTETCALNGEALFNDKENTHLTDVRGIYKGISTTRICCGGLFLVCAGALYLMKKGNKEQLYREGLRGLSAACIGLFSALIGLVIWGLIDFDGLLYTFHLVFFTNDLWLLNPQTDLLVALMPTSFFIYYGKKLLIALLPVLLCMIALPIAQFKLMKEEKK